MNPGALYCAVRTFLPSFLLGDAARLCLCLNALRLSWVSNTVTRPTPARTHALPFAMHIYQRFPRLPKLHRAPQPPPPLLHPEHMCPDEPSHPSSALPLCNTCSIPPSTPPTSEHNFQPLSDLHEPPPLPPTPPSATTARAIPSVLALKVDTRYIEEIRIRHLPLPARSGA